MSNNPLLDAARGSAPTAAPSVSAPSNNPLLDAARGAAASQPVPTPSAGSAPPPPTQTRKTPPGPLDAFVPIVTGAPRAVGTGVGNTFDILNRLHETATAGATGGLDTARATFLHGQSPESQDQTRAELRKKMGIAPLYDSLASKSWTSPNGNVIPGHVVQGLIDYAIDTGTDPLTYLGGLGLLEKGFTGGARVLGPIAARSLETLGQTAPKTAHALGAAYDYGTYKGGVLRRLAAENGAAGIDQFHGLKAINNARMSKAADLGRSLTNELDGVLRGLSSDDKGKLFAAVHTGDVAGLTPALQKRAAAFKRITDSLAHLSGTRALREQLGKGVTTTEHLPGVGEVQVTRGGFTLPDSLNRFDTSVRSLQRPSQYRANYVPLAHEMDTPLGMSSRPGSIEELDQRIAGLANMEAKHAKSGGFRSILEASTAKPEQAAEHTTRLKAEDKNLLKRGEGAQLLAPEAQEKIIRARLASGAKAIAARDAEREVARLFGVGGFQKAPAAAKAFFQETWKEPGAPEFWAGLARGAIDIPKIGLFSLPFRHMANIASLSVLADPSLQNVFGTAGRFARLLAAGNNAEKRAAVLGKANRYGVTSVPSVDRDTAAGWLGKIPGIGDFYKASNHMLWTFDDAAKATRFDRLLKANMKKGMKEAQAAYSAANQVGAELIDYSNKSPLTQALSYILPFATYRTKMPGAIARIVAQHPERILAAGRAAPELVGDEQQAPGVDKVGKSYLPLADALRGVDDPGSYVRSSLGFPAQMAASGIGDLFHNTSNYPTYGFAPDGRYALSSAVGAFPGGDAALNAVGKATGTTLNTFPPESGIANLLRSQTGFGVKAGPTQRQIRSANHIAAKRAEIAAYRAAGNNAAADYQEKKLQSYIKYASLYEK